MKAFLASLDVPTLIFVLVVVYGALTLVVVYTYFFRKTYSGFGAMTLGLLAMTLGYGVLFYQPLGRTGSLFCGNALLQAQTVLLYVGLARYGRIADWRRRCLIQVLAYVLFLVVFSYYLFLDGDTCRRVVVYSCCSVYFYGRIAVEPFWDKRWRTYATQGALSVSYGLFTVVFMVRAWNAWNATSCPTESMTASNAVLLAAILLLSPLMVFCVLAMTWSRIERELRRTRDALRHDALTDALTGLPNRRHFLRQARLALARAAVENRAVSFIMLDLDHFKQINDSQGHQAGDLVLRSVARRLQEVLGDSGLIGRLGGEEFGIVLPELLGDRAARKAMAIGRAVAELRPADIAVTVSMGLSFGRDNLDALLARADACLYVAKEGGRNRLVCQTGMLTPATEGASRGNLAEGAIVF